MEPRRSSEKGFLLIEILAAFTIFAVVAVGLETLLLGTMQANGQASRITEATSLAQDKLEDLRATAYAALASGADGTPLTAARSPGGPYVRSWTVTNDAPVALTKTIRVTVQWTYQGTREVELRTIVYQPPA